MNTADQLNALVEQAKAAGWGDEIAATAERRAALEALGMLDQPTPPTAKELAARAAADATAERINAMPREEALTAIIDEVEKGGPISPHAAAQWEAQLQDALPGNARFLTEHQVVIIREVLLDCLRAMQRLASRNATPHARMEARNLLIRLTTAAAYVAPQSREGEPAVAKPVCASTGEVSREAAG